MTASDPQPRPSPRPEKAADAEALYERFRALDIAFTAHRHDAVFTVEEARALRGDLPGAHCKNLFLKDKKGALYLIVCLEDRRIDMKALSQLLGTARLSFGKQELLAERLGVEPGSVTPFAVVNDTADDDAAVSVVLDAEMMQAPLVNYHPLVNTATVAMAPADLIRFLDVCRHSPRIVDLAPATRA